MSQQTAKWPYDAIFKCPGIQIDITFKLKKVPADKRAYFLSIAHNFLSHLERDWGNSARQEP